MIRKSEAEPSEIKQDSADLDFVRGVAGVKL